MRIVAGITLVVVGLPALLLGGGAAAYVGPDDTVDIAHDEINTDAAILTSTTSVLDISGPTIHVSADAGDTETFVGVAHPVHVDSYLADVTHHAVTQVSIGGDITSTTESGRKQVPDAAPGGLGWWHHSSSGTGTQSISFELSEQPLRVVVTPATPQDPLTVDLDVGAELDGLFGTAVVIGVAGLAAAVGGVLLIRAGRARRHRPADDDVRHLASVPDATADPEEQPADDTYPDDVPADDDAPSADDDNVIPLHEPHADDPPPPPPRPLARVRVLLGLGSAGAVVAGCAQIPDQVDESDRTMSVEAVTAEAADGFFEHYSQTNNEANANRDSELLATVESGTLLETSRFGYAAQAVQGDDPLEPVSLTPSTVAAPRLDEYPLWSFVSAESDDSETESWYLVTRADAASPWRAELAVQPESGTEITAPSTKNGSTVVADDETAAQGRAVLDDLVAFAETGTEPDGVDLGDAGGLNRLPEHGLRLGDAPDEFGSFDRSCTAPDSDQVHWLKTDFGAMSLAAIECTQTMRTNPGYSVTIDDEGLGTLAPGAQIATSSITQSVSFALSVDDNGSATVIGARMRPTAMEFSED